MGTPAVYLNVTRPIFGSVVTTYGDGHSTTTPVSGTGQQIVDERPASVSHHKDSKLWRSPGSWYHSGRKWSFSPGGATLLRRTPSMSPAVANSIDYLGGSCWFGTLPGNYSADLPPSDLVSNAEIKALLKLKAQDANFSVMLAEARETAHTISSRATSIAKQVRFYRSHNPKGWLKVVNIQLGNLKRSRWKEIPSDWLELQYGWLPLMSDVLGAVSSFEKRYNESLPLIRVRAKASRTNAWTPPPPTGNAVGLACYTEFEDEFKVLVSLYYKMVNPFLAKLSSLGLTNPAEIVWEKLRYSFVVDWFLPVGNWLSTFDAGLGYAFHSGTKTLLGSRKSTGSSTICVNPGATPVGYDLSYSPCSFNLEAFTMVRQVYGSSPVPVLYFKSPFSSKHVANALSLLVQAFKR